MSIVDFENIKITTITAIVNLEGNVIIEAAFPLLPITRLEIPENSKSAKKFKIPWPGKEYAGSIFSAKFAGITRGLIKTNKGKSFRNSIGIDICTSGKNISAKLSKNKVHMCGANSEEIAFETTQHIIDHLVKIQKELDYISEHMAERDEVIRWLIKETKGEQYIINEESQEIVELEDGEMIRNSVIYDKNGKVKYNFRETNFKWEDGDYINTENVVVNKYGQAYYRSLSKKEKKDGLTEYPIMVIGGNVKIDTEGEKNEKIPKDEKGVKYNKVIRIPLRVMEVLSIRFPASVLKSLKEEKKIVYPKNINPRIADFLLKYVQDYAYHHVFTDFLENFKEITKVFTYKEVPEVRQELANPLEKEVMKQLPFVYGNMNIAMINFSYSLGMNVDRRILAELIDGYEGFSARYNNTTDHHVTITVPYIVDKDESIKRKGNSLISFMVYKSGIVTQSGPSPRLMRPIYYQFMNFISQHRDEISLKDNKPFSLKYRPVSSEQVLIA